MNDAKRSQLLDQIAAAVGDDAFNRLVGSLEDVRLFKSLRFWQEDLLGRAGVSINWTEFIDLFNEAKWRKTGRSRDALTAAMTVFLAPTLREHGFKNTFTRAFARVMNDCVYQYISLQLSSYGSKTFAVNYNSILLTGGGNSIMRRLPCGNSHDGWWNAKTLKQADESMKDVCEKIKNFALPWFDSTSSVLSLAQELEKHVQHPNPYTFFDLGCCYATAGQLTDAIAPLQEAIRLFQYSYDEMPDRTWALEQRKLAENLVAAIEAGTHATLLSDWRNQAVVKYKLN